MRSSRNSLVDKVRTEVGEISKRTLVVGEELEAQQVSIGVRDKIDYERLTGYLQSCEGLLAVGRELGSSRLDKLRVMALSLVGDANPEAKEISQRIIHVKNLQHTVRNVNYIRELEKEYDRLKKEFLLATTSPERKAELAKLSKEMSETLQILQR
jgi:hypothetical protein